MPHVADSAASAQALAIAYRYLSRRERTVHELRQHLTGRGLGIGAVAAAVAELTEQGYLDDARYARMFTQDKRELAQWGSERIRRELVARGIARDLVEAAVGEAGPALGGVQCTGVPHLDRADLTELDRAMSLLQRRFPDPPRDRREHQRAVGMLLRRGYELDVAQQAISTYARGEA